jgi:hypothetical protein
MNGETTYVHLTYETEASLSTPVQAAASSQASQRRLWAADLATFAETGVDQEAGAGQAVLISLQLKSRICHRHRE